MYDDWSARPFCCPAVEPWDSSQAAEPGLDRLTHLVLVDGRLVDMWSEPVAGTRWHHQAERFDREPRPAPVATPPPPPHEQVLTWLDAAVGGREALLALHTGPLLDDGFEPHPDLRPLHRELLETTVDLLDHGAAELRVPEARALLARTLRTAWQVDPDALLELGEAARLAGGVCWLAAKANGLLGPAGTTTNSAIQHAVGCRGQLAAPGQVLLQLIAGVWPEPPRPHTLPDLVLVGRADLLTTATRRRLVRARDQALAARSVAGAKPGVTPG
jgi:hypothetical protein